MHKAHHVYRSYMHHQYLTKPLPTNTDINMSEIISNLQIQECETDRLDQ